MNTNVENALARARDRDRDRDRDGDDSDRDRETDTDGDAFADSDLDIPAICTHIYIHVLHRLGFICVYPRSHTICLPPRLLRNLPAGALHHHEVRAGEALAPATFVQFPYSLTSTNSV